MDATNRAGAIVEAAETLEACPVCHEPVADGQPTEWVPVCPLVYPESAGLQCHERCLIEERERNRALPAEWHQRRRRSG